MKSVVRMASLSIALALGASACRDAGSSPPPHEDRYAVPSPSSSIYPLHVTLRDQEGSAIGADVFAGQPVIVTMFYGSCPAACPLLVSHIKRVEASLSPDVRARVRVLVVSFDAERDTPARLRELARAHHVDTSRWRFAAAPDDDARVLANALGIHYRKAADGSFAHDSVISVLDGEGRVVAREDDPRAELTPLVDAVARIAAPAA